ncbi:WXG100-like domain-containing protein [Streptosporangium soli]|nr:hypothetical protein [Streptosporangium sp. KLBMP 9127]
MSRATSFIKAHPVRSAMVGGGTAAGTFVTAMLAVQWPEGDPDKLRRAADIWDGLAQKIDQSLVGADGAASRVWTKNAGPGVEAFRKMWTGTFAPYPGTVSAHCRRVAEACRTYAETIETIRHVLIVLAIQAWVNIMFTIAWGWATAGISAAVQKQIMDRFFKQRAWVAKRIFRMQVEKILQKSFYYTLDSIGYAGGQQILQWGVYSASGVRRDLTGNDVTGTGENSVQFLRGFAANMAFDGVWDLTKLGPAGRLFPVNRFGDFLSRMAGSTTYTVVDNLQQGMAGDPLPTWEQMISKLIAHGSRTTRPSI